MGTIVLKAIVVSSFDDRSIEQAHEMAVRTFGNTSVCVTPVTEPAVNGWRSFLVAPDGSKLGWHEHTQADEDRKQFKSWLREKKRERLQQSLNNVDSTKWFSVDWFEVTYGEAASWEISDYNGYESNSK